MKLETLYWVNEIADFTETQWNLTEMNANKNPN